MTSKTGTRRKFPSFFKLFENKWLSFACGFAMMAAAGTEYMFSTYAPQLKTLMGYSQTQINFLGTCGNLGISLGFYMGIINDFTNARIVSLLGAIFLFLGWFLLYLGSISFFPTNYLTMSLFMFMQGTGSAACYTAAIANNVPKFSGKSRGTVVGILVSMFGLTSAIFSPIYVHVFKEEVEPFLLFFSVSLPFVSLLGVFFLYPPPSSSSVVPSPLLSSSNQTHNQKTNADHLNVDNNKENNKENSSNNDSDDEYFENEKKEEKGMKEPLLFDKSVQKSGYLGTKQYQPNQQHLLSHPPHDDGVDDPLHNHNNDQLSPTLDNNQKKEEEWKGVPIKAELNSLEIFKNIDFYIIFIIFMLGAGVGLALFNNLGSLVISMGGESASTLVTILSFTNCGGRLIFGFVSDLVVKTRSPLLSRSTCLLVSLVLMAISEIYFILATTRNSVYLLTPGVMTMGLAYGSMMSLTPTLVNEFLGMKYFGGNWGIVRTSPALSGFLLSTLVAGQLYSNNVEFEGSQDCFGWACYGWSFIINLVIVLFGILLCFVLIIRWYLFERSLRRYSPSV